MWFHLSERSPSDERIDVVSVQELFPVLDDVVVVLVVEAVVVQLALLLAVMIRLLHLDIKIILFSEKHFKDTGN